MPSQEDYLDNLLKDIGNDEKKEEQYRETDDLEDFGGEWQEDGQSAPDFGTVADMTEDEIENLLSGGAESESQESAAEELFGASSDMDLSDEDVLKLLSESDDSDMREIHGLLEQDSKHEPVEPDPEEERNALLQDSGDEKTQNRRTERAEEKKRRREELAAKRAEKKERKQADKKAKADKKAARAAEKEQTEQTAEEALFDTAVLDSIVSEADRTGKEEAMPEIPETDAASAVFPEEEAADDMSGLSEVSAEETGALDELLSEEPDGEIGGLGLGLDMGSLFGDSDAEDALLSGAEPEEDSGFQDFFGMGDTGEETASELMPGSIQTGKKGFFSKLLDFFTEEEEEAPENEDLNLSQENREIIKALDKEKDKKKKAKKPKAAEKDKAEKKEKEKPKKPKKEPKPKKEKLPKMPETVYDRKLSPRKVFPVVLVGVSLGVLLFVFINASAEYSDRRSARAAYYDGDYQTCYRNLFGKKLDETESVMYGKSESILYIRLWISEFEMFAGEGDMVRALDSLIQTVDRYPQLYEYAQQWNAGAEVAAGYAVILNYLSVNFDLTEGQAKQIAAEPKDVEYTKIVTAVANGEDYAAWEQPVQQTPAQTVAPSMEDLLPEEEELESGDFVENP